MICAVRDFRNICPLVSPPDRSCLLQGLCSHPNHPRYGRGHAGCCSKEESDEENVAHGTGTRQPSSGQPENGSAGVPQWGDSDGPLPPYGAVRPGGRETGHAAEGRSPKSSNGGKSQAARDRRRSRRRAQEKCPRSVKRGRNFHGVLRRIP